MPTISFLNPGFLFGLPVAVLPFLLLVLFRRRYPRQPFSTFLILKRFSTARMKRLKMYTVLLALLRALMLLLLVLLFSKPAIRFKSQSVLAGGSAMHVLLLDNSFSMKRRLADSTAYAIAKARAKELLLSLQPSAECAVVYTTEPAKGRWQRSAVEAATTVDASLPTHYAGSLNGCAASLVSLLEESSLSVATVYVFSDFQSWDAESLFALQEPIRIQRKTVEWILVPCCPGPTPNQVWIDSVVVVRPAGSSGQTQVQCLFQVLGDQEELSCLSDIYLAGQRVWQKRLSLDNGRIQKTVSLPVRQWGQITGRIFVDIDDALPDDNTFHFSLWNPPQTRVLLVGDSEQNAECVRKALQPSSDQPGRLLLQFETSLGFQGQVSSLTDVIWLNEITRPPLGLEERLRQHLKQGKGAVVVLGARSDLSVYNRRVIGPFGLGQLVQQSGSGRESFALLTTLRNQQGLFAGFPKKIKEEVIFSNYFQLQPSSQAQVHASMNNGSPFVLESRILGGKLFLIAGSLCNIDASNASETGFFVPFVHRLVEAAGSALRQGLSFHTGEPVQVGLEQGEMALNPVVWIDPQGRSVKLPLQGISKGSGLLLPPAVEPGSYGLVYKSNDTTVVSIHVPAQESHLRFLSAKRMEELTRHLKANVVEPSEEFIEYLGAVRRGTDLFPVLLLLLGLVLLLETIVANKAAE